MKTILITGSNGLLGQKLVYLLKDSAEYNVIAVARGENRLIDQSGYTYASVDISKKEEVEAAIANHEPDVVINTAAMTNVDVCESKREECWTVNVGAVKYFADQAEKHGFHLIHLSTDFVFDGEAGPYAEDDKPNPVSYYGESKLAAEKVLQNSNCKWAIARTIIVYGIVDGMSRSNVVLWAKGALEKRQQINVVNDQYRMPTLAEDLAIGCKLIADKEATGIYHISGNEGMTIYELVHKVADFYGLDNSLINPTTSDTLNQPAKRPPRTGFILDKAIADLGYKPKSFIEGLQILTDQLETVQ